MAEDTSPDPLRPYKAYIVLIVAFLGTFVTQTQGKFPWYVDALLVASLAALGAYLTPNPLRKN